FFAGLKHVAIKVISSYTEDQIITSDPSQILAIKKAKQDLASANERANEQGAAALASARLADPATPEPQPRPQQQDPAKAAPAPNAVTQQPAVREMPV
ncbi:MAG: hypothetical protein U1D26_01115, partial [Patescibacteria group bacterium]|nr:hypothetical protein [Patescibacteria group bacterium]